MANVSMPDGSPSWYKSPHAVVLGKEFDNISEMLVFLTSIDVDPSKSSDPDSRTNVQAKEIQDSAPGYMKYPGFSDTSVGGNDAINSYWSFNEDDDIILPLDTIGGGEDGKQGLGCVYKEMYEQHQRILWISCGVPEYTNLGQWYYNAVNKGLYDAQVNPNADTLQKLTRFIGAGVSWAIKLPWLPLIWGFDFVKWILSPESNNVSDYYNFKSAQFVYYKTVNTMLAHLAVGMGLTLDSYDVIDGQFPIGPQGNKNNKKYKIDGGNVPSILRDGPDIFAIMDKRAHLLAAKAESSKRAKYTTDSIWSAIIGNKGYLNAGLWNKLTNSIKVNALNGGDYVGFRVEKSTDSSESLNNTTGEASIAGMIRSKLDAARDAKFTIESIKTPIGFANDIAGAVGEGLKSAGNTITFGAFETAYAAAMGDIALNIPEMYRDSSFSKSYSFRVELRSRLGDPVSIYQSIYIPLVMLLAMGLPRSVGNNAYTSPFILRAYCKGMFNIPFGIIDNMSITRGASEFGWAYNDLPTSVSVNFSIKDLSPAMFSTIADESFIDCFTSNSSLIEYLNTLSGLGLYERIYKTANIKRRIRAYMLSKWKNQFNPYAWGYHIGSSNLLRYTVGLQRVGYLPSN